MFRPIVVLMMAMLVSVSAAHAETKIAVVDVQRVIDDSEKGKQARDMLKERFEKEKASLEKQGRGIALLKEDLDKQTLVLTPEKRAEKEHELRQRIKDFDRLKKDKQEEFNLKQMEILRTVMSRVMEVVNQVAEEGRYTAIFDRNNGPILYSSKEADITDQIIERFNQASGG